MQNQNPRVENEPLKILFLFSDTGGGHRSAAEAITEALSLEFGERVESKMVDIFKNYAPRPLNRMPELYPDIVRIPRLWELGYRLTDGSRRVSLINAGIWPYLRRSIRNLVAQHPSDLIVSVHPLANEPVLKALGKRRPPYVTVVTDLVTAHAAWYSRKTDLCIVPTEDARRRALRNGLSSSQVKVIGLPVADRFCHPGEPGDAIRKRLGWPSERMMVLIVGGGEGMGPLGQTARAIADSGLPIGMAVITGRNTRLKAELEAVDWPLPTYIYGFVREMPDFMRAADVLVTKAGPGTISEALNTGLPMVLYSRLPGQEEGNVDYVTREGAGVWAPKPGLIVTALRNWYEHPEQLEQAKVACNRLARPQAARQIADLLFEKARQNISEK